MTTAQHAVAMAARAYVDNLPSPFRPFVGDYDSQAFVHVSDVGTITVAFRGSESRLDWLAVCLRWQTPFVPVAGARVHAGFMRQYSSLRGPLVQYLVSLDCAEREILVTGHSLGGALATMFALELALACPRAHVVCCAFSAPRTGNRAFVRAADRTPNLDITRVHVVGDIIPGMPYFGYHHTSRLYRVPRPAYIPWYDVRGKHSIELLRALL